MTGASRVLINGVAEQRLSVLDRGFSYGDGVFETILVRDGHAPHWQRHCVRLAQGCKRLYLPLPDVVQLEAEVRAVCLGLARAVVRVTVTRGQNERGYKITNATEPTRVVAGFPLPTLALDDYQAGIRLRWCALRLGLNKDLAGIKHLNRLEQVLARAEWDDPAIGEGLLRDHQDNVISAIAANVFFTIDGKLTTPLLESSGVAGVARAAVLELLPKCTIRTVGSQELMQAGEIFLTSSVRGIVPVAELDTRHFSPGPIARKLQKVWRVRGWSPHKEM